MGMNLQDAINFASDPANYRNGLNTFVVVTVHEDTNWVFVGDTTQATFRADLPLRAWGTGTIGGSGSGGGRLFSRQIPGFSTRGQGGLQLNPALAGAAPFVTPIPIDVSVRRDSGSPILRFLGLGPSVQIEIETLTAIGGTATGGVTLQATEDGALVRAVGPSLRNPANRASYTVTLDVSPIIP